MPLGASPYPGLVLLSAVLLPVIVSSSSPVLYFVVSPTLSIVLSELLLVRTRSVVRFVLPSVRSFLLGFRPKSTGPVRSAPRGINPGRLGDKPRCPPLA